MLAVVIGLINIKDFFAFKRGITLSIPESAKPGIYDPAQLKRALSPYGRVHVFHYARRPVRDRLPFRKTKGGRIFLFQVTPPNPPGAR